MERTANPVIAIGLDAAEPSLLEKWMDQGYLKNLSRLREQGIYGRLDNFRDSNVETAWTTFSTGCPPQKTGYWAMMGLKDGTYDTETRSAYDYQEHPPFFSFAKGKRVISFDVPQLRLNDQVAGMQVGAWGAHSPQIPSGSVPESLFQDIIDKHGPHPGLHNDYAICLDVKGTMRVEERFLTGIERRSKICQDLMQREPWDLFLTVFSETHGGGHIFWQLSQPDHPLYEALRAKVSHDPLLAIYEAIDKAIGEILAKAPENARVIIFSAHGMGPATIDLPTFLYLPEFMYRYNFPGQYGLGYGEPDAEVPPMVTEMQWNYWERHLWGSKYDPNPIRRFLRKSTPTRIFNLIEPWLDKTDKPDLISPFKLKREGEKTVPWNPGQWYKPLWSQMKAFAVPSFAEGYVRINLKGREPNGLVDPAEYHAVCDDICEKLYRLKEPRTGIAMVTRIVRTRENPLDRDPKLPDADLIVVWQDEFASDVMESPDYGKFGPLPPYRSGSHRSKGFFMATGPDVPVGEDLTSGHVLDLAPTILDWMGTSVPEHLDGKPLEVLQNQPIKSGV
jgi:predicted AlkP superfamily phosphohydrolase/phosphomutase